MVPVVVMAVRMGMANDPAFCVPPLGVIVVDMVVLMFVQGFVIA
jgi:hypothetical protein